MIINSTRLRQDLYHVLDSIFENGEPIEIEHRGKKLIIEMSKEQNFLENSKKGQQMNPDEEELIVGNWTKEWTIDMRL